MSSRPLLLTLCFAAVLIGASDLAGQEEPAVRETVFDLPLASETEIPSVETILLEQPFDWVIFKGDERGDRLLKTEPLRLRPNAYQQILDRVKAAQDALLAAQRQGDADLVDQRREELNQARMLRLNMYGDRFGFEYEADYEDIAEILHHEDLALRRADLERRGGNTDQAWEMVAFVQRIDPSWPGLADTIDRILFSDAQRLLDADQPERALAVLDQLFDRSPRFQNLDTRYGQAVRSLSLAAYDDQNYRRARYYLSRLSSKFPSNKVVRELTERYGDEARRLIRDSDAIASGGDARAAAEQVRRAGKIWADLRGEKRTYERITRQYPILHVGVRRAAEPAEHPFLAGPSNWRHDRLTTPRLFHLRSIDADLVRYGSDFVRDWRPEDLGREVVFQLKDRQPVSQPQPILSSYEIADDLIAAVEATERFGDRYAATLLGVRPTRSDRLELRLGVQPLRVQAFLATVPLSGPGPFRGEPVTDDTLPARQAEQMVRFVRSASPPVGTLPGAVAEVVEHQFASGDEMVRALQRAEVDMLSDVPLFTAVRLLADSTLREDVIAGPCSLPETHILQFRPGGTLAATTELRRGMAVAIDRQSIMTDVFFHGLQSEWGRLTTTMLPKLSYAADPTLDLRSQDRFAATALGLVGKRRVAEDGWGPWKMITPTDATSREAAERLVEQLRAVGYPVELAAIEDQPGLIESDGWEILYRRVQIAEPLVDIWPTLALGDDALISELDHLPETLRRRVLDLERIDDWSRATELLRAIDRSLWANAIVIPLWELDRISLRRRSIREAPDPPLWPYDGLGQWRLEPVIQKTLQ